VRRLADPGSRVERGLVPSPYDLQDRDVERKVYIHADNRAQWGTVKLVLNGVSEAGILRVAFLAYQRSS